MLAWPRWSVVRDCPGLRQIGKIRQRMANCHHLPVQNTNDSGFRLVKYQVIDFEVAMHETSSIIRLVLLLAEERQELVEMRELSNFFSCLLILCLRLRLCKAGECLDLSLVKAIWTAQVLKSDIFGVYPMQLCQRSHCISPHLSSLMGVYPRHSGVVNEASFKALHDVEGSTDNAVIFAEDVGFRDGDIGLFEGVNDLVLAIDSMGCLREELARRLLPENVFRFRRVCDLVCGIALTEAKLWQVSGKSLFILRSLSPASTPMAV